MSTTNNLAIKLSKPAQRALAGAGIEVLKDLAKFTEKEIKALHGMGPSGIKEIKKVLDDNKLTFKKE